MPLQNRVDPFGNLFKTPARGTIMGNRGGVLLANQQSFAPSKAGAGSPAFWNSRIGPGS